MSLAKQISLALTARLEAIGTVNGHLTDIGLRVFRGKRTLHVADAPCIVIVEGPDRIEDQTLKLVKLSQRYILEAHDACDADNPNDKAHDMLEDLKRTIFSGDKTLGKLVNRIEYVGRTIGGREDGMTLTFASIEVDIVFAEDLAKP